MKAGSLAARQISSSVTRWGITTGSRLWTRSRRRCGIAANWPASRARSASGSISGSPPLRITSWIERSAAIFRRAGSQPAVGGSDLRRESAAGSRSGNGRRRPQLLPSRFGLGTSAADRARTGVGLAERVGTVAGRGGRFGRPRQDLQQQRVGRVAGADAGQVGPRHQQRKAAGRACRLRPPSAGSSPSRRQSSAGLRTDSASDRLPVGAWPASRACDEFAVQLAITANFTITRPPQKAKREEQSWPATTPAISARA